MKKIIEKIKKLDKFKLLVIVIVILLVVGTILVIVNHNKKKIVKVNKKENIIEKLSGELYKEIDLDGFKFSNIRFEYNEKIFTYIVEVTNTTEGNKDFNGVAISLMKDDQKIGNIELYNKTTVEPGESIVLKNFSAEEFTEANGLEYSLIN